jgi:hypothetical protein
MEAMDAQQVALLRDMLATTDWPERTEGFARRLRTTRDPGGLMLLGGPETEPWHLAAHLDDEARYSGISSLAPTLVRWSPPPGAPAHLSVGMDRLAEARRGETLLVVSPEVAPVPLLERVDDARRTGATILAMDRGDKELRGLAHDQLSVSGEQPLLSFDGAQHLVSSAAGNLSAPTRRSLRDHLARFLDLISGPARVD